MAYSGIYKVKNPKKYRGDFTKVVFRSGWELKVFIWCDNNPDVKEWSSEEVVIPYFYAVDKKYHRYFVDLKIKYKSGKTVLVEIKPEKETELPKVTKTKKYMTEALTYVKNINKWEAADNYAKDRGWEFQVWTEKTLQEMKLMAKMPGKLKTYKPYKAYKKPKKMNK